mmetsp:Transcript_31088/g.52508  ORF Transcript_31088/g.52508 Transcript_31088/m.52508 type:complete len:200 (+) Transcript_31088:491-1090(+)
MQGRHGRKSSTAARAAAAIVVCRDFGPRKPSLIVHRIGQLLIRVTRKAIICVGVGATEAEQTKSVVLRCLLPGLKGLLHARVQCCWCATSSVFLLLLISETCKGRRVAPTARIGACVGILSSIVGKSSSRSGGDIGGCCHRGTVVSLLSHGPEGLNECVSISSPTTSQGAQYSSICSSGGQHRSTNALLLARLGTNTSS